MSSAHTWYMDQVNQLQWQHHHALMLSHADRAIGSAIAQRLAHKQLCLNQASSPCGQCQSCLSLSYHPDLHQIRLESESSIGVDRVRDVITQLAQSPTYGQKRVLIIDPVDALTLSASNSLLKTLEEPPSHCQFILISQLAGTVLPTIKSRVLHCPLRNPDKHEMTKALGDTVPEAVLMGLDFEMSLVIKWLENEAVLDEYRFLKRQIAEVALGKTFAVGTASKMLELSVSPIFVLLAWLRDTKRMLLSLALSSQWDLFYQEGALSHHSLPLLIFSEKLHQYQRESNQNPSFNRVLHLDQLLLNLRKMVKELSA